MEKKRQDEELTEEELAKAQGGLRMARRPGDDLEAAGTFPKDWGNLGGDIVDEPTEYEPTIGEVIPMPDPPHHA